MKDGLSFVDCDMHIMEPVNLFDKYLNKKFRDRVVLPVDSKEPSKRGMIVIDGKATSLDHEMQQHRKRSLPKEPRRRPRSRCRAPTRRRAGISILPSTGITTRKLKSWSWSLRGSRSPLCSRPWDRAPSPGTIWTRISRRRFVRLTTTGFTSSRSTAQTN